jgi:uncharacterized protein (DUF433 family)
MLEIAAAEALVSKDELFDGEPVFLGTRVPVRTIAAFLDSGESPAAIKRSFPAVTDEMIHAAPLWAKVHPLEGRLRRFGEINPHWTIIKTKSGKLSSS